jgi:tetratricopeptide (TPR) repeat protein
MAYSYNRISIAFANLNQYDSACIYIEKSIPYYKYINDSDKSAYLANIGLFYKDREPQKAKKYLEIALKYGEHPGVYEHLADIYYSEGEKEKAYELWKSALKTNGRYEKDNILYSILSYDIEKGRLDEVCKNIDQVIAIKDSMLYQLRNDTVKDMQLRFDHEVAMHEADRTLLKAQWIILGLISLLLLLSYYTFSRKKREATLQKDHQMQLLAYTTEINKLKENRERTLAQIAQLKAGKDKDDEKIRLLEEDIRNAEEEIQTLNTDIKDLLDDLSPKLKQGRMLYDQICEGAPIVGWTVKEEELFNNYFASVNYKTYDRLRKVKRASRLSTHNLFYLILKEIGKTDDEIRNIMGLSPEGLRSIRSRTKPI